MVALDALSDFEAKAVRAGHPGIHFDAVVWGVGVLPGSHRLADPSTMVGRLPFATASSYTWCHHVDLLTQPFPLGDWDEVRRRTYSQYEQYPRLLGLPFIPNISVGWDCSPRTSGALSWEARKGYGWTPVFECAVGTIKSAARDARSILRAQAAAGAPQIVTVNAWNEWTEGSYLMPDSDRGLELLATLSECFPR